MDPSDVPRAKRQKKDKVGRFAALERLKSLKEKGVKNKCDITEVQDVYDTVDEAEYTKRVLKRQDDDWIVEEGGSGYVEDGREIFDDDLDSESISAVSKSKSTKKRKKAVAENAGKGNLQYMISNMPSKKKEEVNLDGDDLLSDLISEIDDVGNDATPTRIRPKPIMMTPLSEKKLVRDYMKSFSIPKPKLKPQSLYRNPNVLKEVVQKVETPAQNFQMEIEKEAEKIQENHDLHASDKTETVVSSVMEVNEEESDLFDDFNISLSELDAVEDKSETQEVREEITEEQLLSGWQTMQEGFSNDVEEEVKVENSQMPMDADADGNKVFRFFWWDAYEDKRIQPGVVLLFGKTYCATSKTYASCCVTVRHIERKIYLLPRIKHLDANNKPTEKLVALIDVYHEFNDATAKDLNLEVFKSRKVTKNYAFDPSIPKESEYLEIRYSAKYPSLPKDSEGKTYSKVFGTNTSFLEIFLLERKIKGPCWLDIVNAEPVRNPVSWCKIEMNCAKVSDLSVAPITVSPPPLVVSSITLKTAINQKTMKNEIVMIAFLVHNKYAVDKQAPHPPFQQHFCVFRSPTDVVLPYKFHERLTAYKGTKVQKMDSERALLNFFLSQFAKFDPDLIVSHDLQGCELNVLCERLLACQASNISRFGKIKRNYSAKDKLEFSLLTGRLVCDMKISAKELIKSRSYDLNTLCETVLKTTEGQRMDIDPEDVLKMFQTNDGIFKLVALTMQDTAFILKMMYELNVIPLALQITNIAGNVMSKTLLGGRSERNEFLLLHAFSEKNYIPPDKVFKSERNVDAVAKSTTARKKPTYSGGLVLDPKIGFYDKLILLMDFNSLYPSIIQEYNICFTTVTGNDVLPDQSLPPGILPIEIRNLVNSRRAVKKLMNSHITKDLHMQYNIRQMALKLTANSMYGCLGFAHSRFYAKNLAALVTHKGREILMNTRDLVQNLSFEVIYGDTDSIMINTNSLDYDEVYKIGNRIKQEVNKVYRQVELDIDGVFKYLLLLKKKKYAAVTLTKSKDGKLVAVHEYKGLDIVRRDWSQLAAEAGKVILGHILSDQTHEERIENIESHLTKLKVDMEENKVPLPLLVITKQLTKDPKLYPDKNTLPHVQVALRYNENKGKRLRAGDTVPYVICDDGTTSSATQRAYHVDELKNSETLKIDINYYLSQQMHPVVSRLCGPIEGIDSYQIASCLGLDMKSFKKPQTRSADSKGENRSKPEVKFRNAAPFVFKCMACKAENTVTGVLRDRTPFLEQCINPDCNVRPVEYLPAIRNQLTLSMRGFISKYYANKLTCEDPMCTYESSRIPMRFAGKYPVCPSCKGGVLFRKYSGRNLYTQLTYFQHIFNLSSLEKKPLMEDFVESGYYSLKEVVDNLLRHSAYSVLKFDHIFDVIYNKQAPSNENAPEEIMAEEYTEDEF